MNQSLITQEVAIVIAMTSQNPSLLSEDFLKYSGVIPSDWQLERPAVYNQQVAQLVFTNGFSIALQADRVMFLEAIGDKELEETVIGDTASKYVEALKLADYQAFGVNFRSYVSYGNDEAAATDFVNSKVLMPKNWQSVSKKPVRATVNLNYELDNSKMLNLSINEASIQFPEKEAESIVLFSANFNKDLKSLDGSERIQAIQKLNQDWQKDLGTFTSLVIEEFLGGSAPIRQSFSEIVTVEDAALVAAA
jgi:hypothetical protein